MTSPRTIRHRSRRRLGTRMWRENARGTRDEQWAFMERLAREGVVYVCLWNRSRRAERRNELRLSMLGGPGGLGGMDVAQWVNRYKGWFGQSTVCSGHQDDCVRYWLTPAGRRALLHCQAYDMQPVKGGLVGPGWQSRPLERHLMPFLTLRGALWRRLISCANARGSGS